MTLKVGGLSQKEPMFDGYLCSFGHLFGNLNALLRLGDAPSVELFFHQFPIRRY